jgi:DNA-binding NtrC family response regulator
MSAVETARPLRGRPGAPALWAGGEERDAASALAELAWCNPFLPRRVELERRALGDEFVPSGAVWHRSAPGGAEDAASPNVEPLARRGDALVTALHDRLVAGAAATAADVLLYRDLVFHVLYARYQDDLFQLLPGGDGPPPRSTFAHWGELQSTLGSLQEPVADRLPEPLDPAHLLACFFQVRRAFHFLHHFLLGASAGAATLRAECWHSVFGHDMRRYQRALWRHMADIPTLVTGPSGTGKELVARAIALSRYAPFQPAERSFAVDLGACFYPLQLAALPPTLVESELFGHRRGAFTGAIEDRAGWLEVCPPAGTVFLDEIGEIEGALQVKLLRVLEGRTFQRLGETRPRRFNGKLVAATHRDLALAMREGRFREDLFYRLCGDMVRTPSLAERVRSDPGELPLLAGHLAQQLVGPQEGPAVAAETLEWIARELPADYPWPGNVRELGQCLRNVLVRREYHPRWRDGGPVERLAREMTAGSLTSEQLARRYATLVYARSGSYLEASRRLGLDRRTVRAHVDRALLAELRGETGPGCADGKAGDERDE